MKTFSRTKNNFEPPRPPNLINQLQVRQNELSRGTHRKLNMGTYDVP